MLQRDDRHGSRGRPSLFSEAPDALGADKNILKQLDGTLAASARVAPGMLLKRGIVGGMLVLCTVVAGLAWTFGQADRPAAAVRVEALASPQVAAPSLPAPAPAQAAESAQAPVAVPAASFETGTAASAAGTAALTPTTVTQPRDRPQRPAARAARGKPAAAAERHGHKVKTRAAASPRQSAGTRAKARGKDKSGARAQHRPTGKRQDAHARDAASRGARGTRDSDAALLEAVLAHGRAFGAASGKAAAGHCDPVKGSGAGRGRRSNTCGTHNARNTTK